MLEKTTLDTNDLKSAVEALIFAADGPIPADLMARINNEIPVLFVVFIILQLCFVMCLPYSPFRSTHLLEQSLL